MSNPKRPVAALSPVSSGVAALVLLAAATFGSARLAQGGQTRDAILFTDSQAAVLMTDGASTPATVAVGQKLMQPFGICVGEDGEYYVSDTGCMGIIGINPSTHEQRVVSCGGSLGVPFGMAVEPDGSLLVANAQALLRVDPQNGDQMVVSSGGFFKAPIAATVAPSGQIYVLDALGAVIRVDPDTGLQNLVAKGIYLKRPQGIAVHGNEVFVTDVATPDGNFGTGIVIRIDIRNGNQSVLSKGSNLVGPVGIAVGTAGQLIVADPYTINPNSPDISSGGYDGAIIQVDRVTGSQNLIARGQGVFVNPRCVTIIQSGSRL
jgi:streptogramin lyase